ncbi:hypothetical protein AAHA92_22083 [Salvia divinorum]|uniref:Retrotransposon gag domain-containing protein n=1 Tax=Salvia divinorum TaxID=28513 RepID=A0ABD1GQG4_SALDI
MRLPSNSIRYWAEFRSVFLDYFFLATQTNALKKEIQGATQEGDETLSQYWGRFKGLLDACPNNRMTEAEIYNNFYEGLAPESKDLVNSSSGGDVSRLRLSEARKVMGRLIDAKKAYDNLELKMDRLEKAVLNALEKNKQPAPGEKCQAPLGQDEAFIHYGPPMEIDYQKANAMGNWNLGGYWNQSSSWVPKQRDAPWRSTPISAGRSRTRIHLPSHQAMRSHKKRDLTGQVRIMRDKTTGIEAKAISPIGQVETSKTSMSPLISEGSRAIKVPVAISTQIRGPVGSTTKTQVQEGISTILKEVVYTTISKDMEIPFTTRDLFLISKESDQVNNTRGCTTRAENCNGHVEQTAIPDCHLAQ